MQMTKTLVVPAPVDAVWRALNDPAALKTCIPGCESLEKTGDDMWRARLTTRVGPVSAKFVGTVRMTDSTPPTAYTLKFEGQGGAAGFANGEARVTLAPADDGRTTLTYTARAQVGGKLAQVGSRLIDGAAAKLAGGFFERFNARFAPAATPAETPAVVARQPPAAAPGEVAETTMASPGASTFAGGKSVRYVALVLIVAMMVWLYIRGGVRF